MAVEARGRQAPAQFGTAPPRPAPRAGRVDEHAGRPPLPVGEHRALLPRIEQPGFDPRRARAFGARRELLEARAIGVAGQDIGVIAGAGGYGERLAATAGAEVDDRLPRPARRVAEARILTTTVSLHAGSKLFELAGTSATLDDKGLDRFWRNARTHTLHDPVRWKYHAVGNYYLNDKLPPRHGAL